MQCQICKQREATAHYVQVVDSENVLDLFICQGCAEKLMKSKNHGRIREDVSSISSFIPDRFRKEESLFCPSCGKTLSAFIAKDYRGCSECFSSFMPHLGRIKKLFSNTQKLSSLKDLKESMKLAVLEDRFEDAATIRDQIKSLLSKNTNV